MADIATLSEFASALQTDVDTATSNLLLLDLAQGLIEEQIGTHDPWPTVAKATALAAATRAYVNPVGARVETTGEESTTYASAEAGVYLTTAEVARLQSWLSRPGSTATAGQGLGFGTIYLTVPGA